MFLNHQCLRRETSLSIKINEILSKKNFKSCLVKKFYKNQLDEQKILEKNGKLFLSTNRMDALIKAENENYKIAVLDDGLQDKSINLVSIASYDSYHYEQAVSCIKANKHVFIEKPFCQNNSQFQKIKKLLFKKKVYFSTNFVLRNHPKFVKIQDLVRKRKIGKIYHIEGDYNYGRLKKLTKGWRGRMPYYSVTQGGGIHMIDLMVLFLGNFPVEVISSGNKIVTKNTKYNNDDFVISNFKFKNGALAKISANFGEITA